MPRQRSCNASEFREKERMPMAEKTDERVTDEKVVEIEMEIFYICATNLEKILICGIINIYFDLEMILCI